LQNLEEFGAECHGAQQGHDFPRFESQSTADSA
jgi:hypothetical protein